MSLNFVSACRSRIAVQALLTSAVQADYQETDVAGPGAGRNDSHSGQSLDEIGHQPVGVQCGDLVAVNPLEESFWPHTESGTFASTVRELVRPWERFQRLGMKRQPLGEMLKIETMGVVAEIHTVAAPFGQVAAIPQQVFEAVQWVVLPGGELGEQGFNDWAKPVGLRLQEVRHRSCPRA